MYLSMNAAPSVRISDFLREENVICPLKARTSEEAIDQLLQRLHRNEGGFDLEAARKETLNRELAGSTILQPGVAMPHARLEGLERLMLAVGTTGQGVDFHVHGAAPVQVILLILTPKSQPGAYLQFLAGISKTLLALKEIRVLAGCAAPAEVCGLLASGAEHLPPFLSATHVMNPQPVTLLESDHLGRALDVFCIHHLMDLPVVDEQGDVRGVVSLEDLLRLSLPEHMLWVEDLSPILQFEPFADLLRKERETRLADFMREEYVAVAPDLPAIQLARLFLNDGTRLILVVDGRKLAGVVTLSGFIAKLFWA